MRKGRSLPLCAMALLAACHGDSGQTPVTSFVPHAHAPRPVKQGPSLEELTAGMVEAVTNGNSTVPVAVKFDLTERPMVGLPLEVVIAVMPQIVADLAVLTVVDSEGLKAVPGTVPIQMPSVEPAQVYRQSITVIPVTEGVHLLALDVSLKHDETTETRSFSVPLIVAASPDSAVAKP